MNRRQGERVRRVLHVGLVIALSAAVVGAIVFAVGLHPTVEAVAEAGFAAFGGVGGLTVGFLLIQAAAWSVLNRPIGHRIRLRTLFGASLVGLAGNILTPSTFLGGEPLKVVYAGHAARLPYHEVGGTVLLSKYLEAIAFILFFSFSTGVAAVGYRETLFGRYLALGITVLAVGLLALFLKPALFFYLGAGITLDVKQLCLLFVVGQALLAFQLTPSGAGVLDAGLIGAFALMDFPGPDPLPKCMAFLLCLRLWDAVTVGVGALLGARRGARILSSRREIPDNAESQMPNGE